MPLQASLLRMLRRHWPLALVLAAAALLRAAVAIAYRPALFFGDSWSYLDLAYGGSPVGFAPDRPSGYPLFIDLLSIAGRELVAITTAQHLAGLAVAVLVYALLLRLGIPRLVATAGAAVVALDGYAIALEQQIMAEALFTLALVASMYLAVGRDRGGGALVASGALLGAAATLRTAALFAVPVWIAYVVWSHGRSPRAAAALVALVLPLLAYSGVHAAATGKFGLTQADGWFLYGRVGQFAGCDGLASVPPQALPLCDRTPRDSREGAAFHVWNADGPARRAFVGMSRDHATQERSNRVLRQFALAVIRERPLRYTKAVAGDFLRYFSPGEMSLGNSDLAVILPARGRLVRRNELVRDRYFPSYRPQVYEPAERLRSYQQAVHTPRWLMSALAIASALSLLAAAVLRGRARLPRRRETFLLTGAALAMLLGSAATSEFVLRYLIPVVPLIVCGGLAALADIGLVARSLSSRFSSGRGSRASESRRAAIRNRPVPAPALSRRAGAAARALLLARRP